MTTADGNVNDILFEQAKKLAEKKAFANRTYKDEPLLFTASRLIAENDAPECYREMLKLSDDPRYGYSDAARFYAQAKIMEDFNGEEDYVFRGTCRSVYPSYSRMSVDQLRGYFSWRTKVRRGDVRRTEYAFVQIYISELINLIGVKDAADGFEKLTDFLKIYSREDSYILFQGMRWAKNFAIYYNIPPERYAEFASVLRPAAPDTVTDDNVCVLIEYKKYPKQRVFEAITALSTYSLAKSKWVRVCPGQAEEVVYRVYAALYEKYEGSKTDLIRLLFPFMKEMSYSMNFNSLFYQKEAHPDCVYRLSPLEIYECRSGVWTCTGTELFARDFRSPDLGILLKAIDCNARIIGGIMPQLRKPPVREQWNRIIIAVLKEYHEELEKEKQARRLREVKIDRGLLAGIRSDSDETREKLMTDDERGGEEEPPAPPEQSTADTAPQGGVFTPGQREFISLVLSGGDLRAFAKSRGGFVSGFADEINAIALEYIGDTVIECEGNSAVITEDYIDELKEMAGL